MGGGGGLEEVNGRKGRQSYTLHNKDLKKQLIFFFLDKETETKID